MLLKCWMVICQKGKAVFLDYEKAVAYATKHHGSVVNMFGQTESENANL